MIPRLLISAFLLIGYKLPLSAQFIYISPIPGSKYHNRQATIILKTGDSMDVSSLTPDRVSIVGSKSGTHSCRVVLADDGKTIVIYPIPEFVGSERVDVTIADGFRKRNGTMVKGVSFYFETHKDWTPQELEGIRKALEFSKQQAYGIDGLSGSEPTASIRNVCYQIAKPEILTNTSNAWDAHVFYYNFRTTNPLCFARTIIENDGDTLFFRQDNNQGVGFSIASNGYLIYHHDITVDWRMADSSYNEIASFQLGNGYVADEHDFDIFPNGRRLMLAYDTQIGINLSSLAPGKDSMNVIGLIVQELDASNNVLFEWRSWDHLEFDDAMFWIQNSLMNLPNGGTYDWVHGNSVRYFEDTALLVSCRHTSSIMKISLNTGKIIWEFGGENNDWVILNDPDAFTAADGNTYYFSGQHDAHILPNGNLLMFNNDNNLLPAQSGAKEYHLNQSTMTATLVWRYVHPPYNGANMISNAMGNAQRLPNGNTFINWGLIANVSQQFPKMTEVDPAGNIVWEFRWDADTINYSTYRGRKYEWRRCNLIPPDSYVLDSVTNYSAQLMWEGHSKISSYTLRYRPCGTSSWTTVTLTTNYYELTNLTPGTCYEWQVQANCSLYNESAPWGPLQQFVTLNLSAPEAPSGPFQAAYVLPNPVHDQGQLFLLLSADVPLQITVTDAVGSQLWQKSLPGISGLQTINLPARQWAKGAYWLQIRCPEQVRTLKLLRQ
ncbi:MAG: aryl-sulfate sulfotransferase [Chitinophagales bacterium]|nr:aryl-sulfate sulfotransferase [Chitinophagales bacterium]MDW8392674.1 aryl-sulfate sulfotransferase [Chitinophagales bacterium]